MYSLNATMTPNEQRQCRLIAAVLIDLLLVIARLSRRYARVAPRRTAVRPDQRENKTGFLRASGTFHEAGPDAPSINSRAAWLRRRGSLTHPPSTACGA